MKQGEWKTDKALKRHAMVLVYDPPGALSPPGKRFRGWWVREYHSPQ
jgi:hypothetical protein